jgi:hypothetical protein
MNERIKVRALRNLEEGEFVSKDDFKPVKISQKKRVKINSKKKGNGFELLIAKKLTEWWGETFSRTPCSGGWHKKHEEGKRVRGDLICPNSFPFMIECKKREEWSFDNVFSSKFVPLKWYKKLKEELEADDSDQIPMLIFTKNRLSVYCLSCWKPGDNIAYFGLMNDLYIYQLDDLIKCKSGIPGVIK